MNPSAFDADEVHVWLLRPDAHERVWTRNEDVLSVDERTRLARFAFDHDRQQFLDAHVLLRTALAACTGVAPRDLVFESGPHGRPELSGLRRVRFSLSHTQGLVACTVTRNVEIGLDVERAAPRTDLVSLGRRVFATREFAAFERLPEPERTRRFYELWTLKESYVKARGLGLSLPLQQFSFELDDTTTAIRFEAEFADEPSSWQFARSWPTSEHALALSIRSGPGAPRAIHWHNVGPSLTAPAGTR